MDAMDYNGNKEVLPQKSKQKSKLYCCVPQCSNYGQVGTYFHLFPKAEDLKHKWEIALKMGKPASGTMRVCSKHFLPKNYFPGGSQRHKLFPNTVPSQNLPVRSHDKLETSPQKKKKVARQSRAEGRGKGVYSEPVVKSVQQGTEESALANDVYPHEDSANKSLKVNKSTQANLAHDKRVATKYDENCSLADILCRGSEEKTTQVNLMPSCNERNATAPPPSATEHSLLNLLCTNEKLFTFTGLHSHDLLDGLVDCVSDLVSVTSTNKKILPLKERIVLTMAKLKLNLSFTALGVLFDVSRQTCSNYFKNICPLLSRVLKVMIPWPDQALIRQNLPLAFKNYKQTRVVLDCAETAVEKCKCLKCRILTYSQYKKGFTFKFDLGVTPTGLATEVSPSYGGRASDKFIVNDSKILDKLDFKDIVVVDKGFRIEAECLQRHITLVRPPFLKKKQQLNKEDALETADIARARVHVERVIQRLREFQLLRGPFPWHLAPYFDDCLQIAVGLTNLGPPVIAIHRFM